MKKALAMLMGAVAAMTFSVFSAAAADVEIDAKTAVETSDGVSFTVKSNKLAASQLKEDSTITVTCDGAEGDESPAKLVLDYWDAASSENLNIGEPASVEVAASEYSDGKAVFTYADIKAALGEPERLVAYNTYQVKNYDRYELAGFSEEAKRQWRDEYWEQDLQKAFDAGKRMAEKILAK